MLKIWNGKEFAISFSEEWVDTDIENTDARLYNGTSYDMNGNKIKDTYYKKVNGKKVECTKAEFENAKKNSGW
ncbi:MAG: hypothetical protein J6X11_03420 [Treponema sp.]|nr:hypothetical protein [Treponema sp.]MBR4386885.1 hypothetical protein [Treponema sp.]